MAGVQGFEPQLTDPESAVLPLDDTPSSMLEKVVPPILFCVRHLSLSVRQAVPNVSAVSRLSRPRCDASERVGHNAVMSCDTERCHQ